jgi:flagellar hook-length control protein FliK
MTAVPTLDAVAVESNSDVGKPVAASGGQSFGQVLAQRVGGKGASPDLREAQTNGRGEVKGAAANVEMREGSGSAGSGQALSTAETAASSPKKVMSEFAETETVATTVASSVTPTMLPQQPNKSVVTATDAKPESKKTKTDDSRAAAPVAAWGAPLLPMLWSPAGQATAPESTKTTPTASSADASSERPVAAAQTERFLLAAAAGNNTKAASAKLEHAGAQPLALDTMPPQLATPHPDAAALFSVVLQQAALGGAIPPKSKGADAVPGTPIWGASLPLGANAPAAPTAPSAQLQLSPAVQEQPAWGNALGQSVQWMAQGGVQQALIHLHPQHLGPLVVQLNMSQNGQAAAVFLSDHPEVRAAISAALPQLQQSFAALGLNLTQSNVGSGGSGSASNRRQSADRDADAPGAIEEISSLRPAASGQIHRGLLSTFV